MLPALLMLLDWSASDVESYTPVLHYHTLEGPSKQVKALEGPDKTIRILQGPSKQVHVLAGSK